MVANNSNHPLTLLSHSHPFVNSPDPQPVEGRTTNSNDVVSSCQQKLNQAWSTFVEGDEQLDRTSG